MSRWIWVCAPLASVLLANVAAVARPGQQREIIDGAAIFSGEEYARYAADTQASSPHFVVKTHVRA
jgi:hypothetical protein